MITLETEFLGNTLEVWSRALLIALGTFVALVIVRAIVLRHFKRLALRTDTKYDDLAIKLVEHTRLSIMLLLSLYAGSIILVFPINIKAWINTIGIVALLVQLAIWGNAAIDFSLTRYRKEHEEEEAEQVTTLKALGLVAKIALFSILGLVALDNIPGVEITALVASLGVTGIAVALAVNTILSDLFSSISIALDKPFVIGDFIVVGDLMGNVEDIGLKTTRVRSLSGEELIFSNGDLLSSRIRNFKDLSERRVVFTIGVAYETPHDKLQELPTILRNSVEMHELIRFDRAHFKEFGDFSLNFETVYYVLDPEYITYADIHQTIMFTIFERLSAENIEFAYPTQTIYMGNASNGSSVKTTLQKTVDN